MAGFIKGARLERTGHHWRDENSIAKIVFVNNTNKKDHVVDVAKKDVMDLRVETYRVELRQSIRIIINQGKVEKFVLAAKGLDSEKKLNKINQIRVLKNMLCTRDLSILSVTGRLG